MTLRSKLTCAILAVVAVMGVVTLVSFQRNRVIERQVADLDRTSSESLDPQALHGRTLAVEGRWDERGYFVASRIERLARSRRPKLRGAIQALDRGACSLTVYGREIRVTEETQARRSNGDDPLEGLEIGQRVEVSCKIDSHGGWIARSIEVRDIKSSDKVKGTISSVDPASGAEHVFSIDGLAVRAPADIEVNFPRGPLYRMELTTEMTLSIEEALAAAQTLLKQRYRERSLHARGELERAKELDDAVDEACDRLEEAYEGFAHDLAESRAAAEQELGRALAQGRDDRAIAEQQRIDSWLAPLDEERATFEREVHQLLALAGPDPDRAQTYLQDVLEPTLRTKLAPLTRSYLLDTKEWLSSELEAIAAHAAGAARLAILNSVAGIALAVAVGLVLSRWLSAPILALAKAARRIGSGDLAARVQVRGRDEISQLATSFNRMAEELSVTTISVARLDDVIDSMAGALVILDPEACIASVNSAALRMLGYRREELVGRPFDMVCKSFSEPTSDVECGATSKERVFLRKDGVPIPVSFSSASLQGEDRRGARVCLALDLSERKRMEEELRRSLGQKELLLREVHHRVKNNLQVISSLLELQSRSIDDPSSLERFQASQDRIRSMAYIHDQLHRTDDLDSVDLRAYLELLVSSLADSHVEPPGRVRLLTRLEELRIDIDRALACGLIVNELVTNALKHAFPAQRSGEVVVSCRSTAQGNIRVEVRDNGCGFSGDPADEAIASLGLSLVKTLTRQLHGRVTSSGRSGASFRIEFPAGSVQEVA